MILDKSDKEATPLDPIYVTMAMDGGHPPIERDNDKYNRWRQSLPARCWECKRFQRCSPTNNCPLSK